MTDQDIFVFLPNEILSDSPNFMTHPWLHSQHWNSIFGTWKLKKNCIALGMSKDIESEKLRLHVTSQNDLFHVIGCEIHEMFWQLIH